VSSSAIGKAVARMEERLGVRLFHRSTRSITLTAEGALFLERCRRIFANAFPPIAFRVIKRVGLQIEGLFAAPWLAYALPYLPKRSMPVERSLAKIARHWTDSLSWQARVQEQAPIIQSGCH
jgi:hypothetical protein